MSDQSTLPSLDLDAEDPYPDDQLAAATIERMMKRNRRVESAFSAILSLRRRPFDKETGKIRSFFDLVFESAHVEYLGEPPSFLHFEKRGNLWKEDIERWSELPQVEIPVDFKGVDLPRVLVNHRYSCPYCGYSTQRDDRILAHIGEKHPHVDGPFCIARDESDIITAEEADAQSVLKTLSEFTPSTDDDPPIQTDGGVPSGDDWEMSNEEFSYTFDPMHDLVDRWGITMDEAEVFLERVGYFDTERYHEIADKFDPTPAPDS